MRTEHDITVTINGTNDAPVIGTGDGVMRGEVTEDTSLSTGGTLDDQWWRCTATTAQTGHGRPIRYSTSAPMACGRTLNNADRRSSRAGRRGYVNGNLHSDVGRFPQHDITVTINGIQRCAGHRNGWTRGCGRSDGRHQLEHGRYTGRSVMTMRAKRPHGRKPTRQAHTARSTSAPMRVDVLWNNDPTQFKSWATGIRVNGNLHSDVGRRHRAWHHGDDQRH